MTGEREATDAAASSVVVACLGDSNTCLHTPGRCETVSSWCAQWAETVPSFCRADGSPVRIEFLNLGVGGLSIKFEE